MRTLSKLVPLSPEDSLHMDAALKSASASSNMPYINGTALHLCQFVHNDIHDTASP